MRRDGGDGRVAGTELRGVRQPADRIGQLPAATPAGTGACPGPVPRLRCRRCGRTRGSLPEGVLHRRLDGIDTVGRIIAVASGVPQCARSRWRPACRHGPCVTSAGATGSRPPDLASRLLALSVALGGHLSLDLDIPVGPERRAAFRPRRRHG